MNKEVHGKSVLEIIYDWSLEQSLWKRDALRRVIQNDETTDTDISELTSILEQEQSRSGADTQASVLEKSSLPNRPVGGDDVKIVSIAEVNNVNRLASNQTLEFGQTGITVIFGNNGSGKSGYSRILKSACTARHRSAILPNIYSQSALSSNISSKITCQIGNSDMVSVIWGNSEYPHAKLSAISVFDRQCSEIHIGNENEVSVPFRPLGLDIPEKLVEVYKKVESGLKQRKEHMERSQNSIFKNPVWKDTTTIGITIGNLSHENNIEEIQKKFSFSEDEEQRLKELNALKLQFHSVYRKVSRHLAGIRCRRSSFVEMIKKEVSSVNFSKFDQEWLSKINELEETIQKSVNELKQASTAEGRSKLVSEKDELVDQQWANKNVTVIIEEVKRLKNVYFLEQCIKDTKSTAVIKLGNTLADEAITPQLRNNFCKEITGLVGNKLKVEIVRSGGRAGAPKYKVQLLCNLKEAVPKILSEGEQTCVGIASFFAELAISEHKSSLIFDDPVSSLDHKWRANAAKRLVEEAAHRQVVVFTHDFIFLNDLEDAAKQQGTKFTSRHIKSSPDQAGLVDEVLPWDGMKIDARIDAMRKNACQIKDERSNLDDETYKRRARNFYSDLRASWERALEEVGLSHTVMRHRDYIDSKKVKNLAALNKDMCIEWSSNFGRCCDFTESHDTSRGRAQELPEPDILLEDVQKLSNWTKQLREAHKKIDNQEKG